MSRVNSNKRVAEGVERSVPLTGSIRERIQTVIFGVDTREGKLFDITLIVVILASVSIVILDSIETLSDQLHHIFLVVEWIFTIIFTIEFFFRIYSTKKRIKYVFSFFGIIDLVSIIPTYLSLFFVGTNNLIVIRMFRLLRIFRVLKLVKYMGEAENLKRSLFRSARKITVFLFSVLITTVIFGSIMYLIEEKEHGFTSIPRSVYWAIVTMTTVGYGDISPQTNLGQTLAAIVMILGYAIIAVPTGIVSAEMYRALDDSERRVSKEMGLKSDGKVKGLFCVKCRTIEPDKKAKFCKFCKGRLV